jgi:hypothetical protein
MSLRILIRHCIFAIALGVAHWVRREATAQTS